MNEEDCKTIYNLAYKYDFYATDIGLALTIMKNDDKKFMNYLLKDWGFMIYRKVLKNNITCIIIKFIFIKPEQRRKGIFTKLINTLKNITDIIIYTSEERSMLKFAEKNDFDAIAVCENDKELFYGWSDKYTEDYIYDNYY